MGQDYDKDLYLLIVGSGNTTRANFEDNVEDFIFGDRDSREVTLVIPYTKDMPKGLDTVLNQWAVGADRNEPNYPIVAFVEPDAGHRSISSAKDSNLLDEAQGVYADSLALEEALSYLVDKKKDNQEVAVVVLYDEEKDVKLIGEIKNYNGIPVYNIEGMIDSFPGFKTTEELLDEERKREEFEIKEQIRIAAEKEQESQETKPAPRKRAAKKTVAEVPEEKTLTETKSRTRKAAAPKATPKEESPKSVDDLLKDHPGGLAEFSPKEPEFKVGDVVEVGGIPFVKHSELPDGLEPVRPQQKPTVAEYKALVASGALVPEDLPSPEEVPDLWKDVSRAQAAVSVPDDKLVVSKQSLAQLGEGIKEMSQAYAKTIDALTDMLREGK